MSKRAALVTGASRGVGEAVARRLAVDGFHVFLNGRDPQRLSDAATASGGTAVPFDVTDQSAVQAAFNELAAQGVQLDVVVNSAGVFDLASIVDTTSDVLTRNLDVNLKGAFHVMHAALPAMLGDGRGLIVNVGSVSGRQAYPENGAYAASKFGLRGLHEVLLEEIRGSGVRASLLEPGAVDTPIWDPLDPDNHPGLPGRADMLRPDDVADAVSYLAGLPQDVAVPLIQIQRA
ncbi:MAG: SDR family oxidoreductase [Longimicrobiales bacterium]